MEKWHMCHFLLIDSVEVACSIAFALTKIDTFAIL